MKKPRLTDQQNKNLVKMCSVAAMDPERMYTAVHAMFDRLDPRDVEYLVIRLRLEGQ